MNADEYEDSHEHSVVMVEVNGTVYPMRTESRCFTCQSPYRLEIERLLCAGASYQSIADTMQGRPQGPEPHPGRANLRHHVTAKHMPLGRTIQRALIEEQAAEIGANVEVAATSLINHIAANRMIMQRGMERLVSGEMEPTVAETQAAIRFEHAVQQSLGEDLGSAEWQAALMAYMEVASKFIPQAQMGAYGQALSSHPVLGALVGGSRKAIPGTVVDTVG